MFAHVAVKTFLPVSRVDGETAESDVSSIPSLKPSLPAARGGRDLLKFVGGALLTGLSASVVLAAATLFLSHEAHAEPLYARSLPVAAPALGSGLLPGAFSGPLWRRDQADGWLQTPLLETDMLGQADGVIGRVRMVQSIDDPLGLVDDAVVEVEYRHPLPYGHGAFAVTVSSSPITVRLSASSKL